MAGFSIYLTAAITKRLTGRFVLTLAAMSTIFIPQIAAARPASEPTIKTSPMGVLEGVDLNAPPAGEYKPDADHRYISFSYSHMGFSRPILRWGKWDGQLDWNPSHPERSAIRAVIDARSIDSGVPKLNDHLMSADFFNVETYPEIVFTGSAAGEPDGTSGQVNGELTIKGVTKPVTLNVTLNKAGFDEIIGAYKLGFSATASVKRSDFGLDAYLPDVGDEIQIKIESEFVPSGHH